MHDLCNSRDVNKFRMLANAEHPDYMFVGIFAGQPSLTEDDIVDEIERLISKQLDPIGAKSKEDQSGRPK